MGSALVSQVSPARRVALAVLVEAARRDARVRELLDSSKALRALDRRDASFARRLVLGATATEGCLDQALDAHLSKPGKVAPRVRAALRLAAFELIYLGQRREVAVSQGVELVRSQARAAAGLANAVLRRVADDRDAFLSALDVDAGERSLAARARRAGLPVWLLSRIEASLGDTAASELCAAQLEPAPIAICAAPAPCEGRPDAAADKPGGYCRGFERPEEKLGDTVGLFGPAPSTAGNGGLATCGFHAGATACTSGVAENPYTIDEFSAGHPETPTVSGSFTGQPGQTGLPAGCEVVSDFPAFVATGALERVEAVVSDVNAQTVALAATRPGSCLEIGAGRGTKTYVMAAAAKHRGLAREHVALELYPAKCRQNLARLERAGLSDGVRVIAGDATDLDTALTELDAPAGERRLFDTVLVDAPCSGTGTMRRHPEIPWRLAERDVDESLPGLQLRLLQEAARRVAPGGLLVYATCSVLSAENDRVVDCFLATEAGRAFGVASRHQTHPAPGAFDGHYHAVLRRADEGVR